MATPVIENICVAILAAINAITTGNGYQQNLVGVRPKRSDFRTAAWNDLTAVIALGSADEIEPTAMEKTWRQNFEIMVFAVDSDDATAAIDTRLNKIAADIEKKLMVDETQGVAGAIDTNMTGRTPFRIDETGAAGISVYFWVMYRTLTGDPYTAA